MMTESSMLRVGTVLRGIYRIDKYLSSGGFGNTYVGYNMQFDERIAIKEFFMKGITARDDNQTSVSISNQDNSQSFAQQNEKFKKEAKRLRKLKNPHIVGVHDLFEENGTAYYVMDFIDGENLAEKLKRTGKPLTEDEVWELLPQLLDALKCVHNADLWHLDLKPGNIMVDKQGNAKLIDFGASKQLDAQKGGATASTAAVSYTNGYAPREQMEQNYEKFGPWTDIYALGATLYNLLTNKYPPLPSDLDDDDSGDKHETLSFPIPISDNMHQLILWMMNTHRSKRPQSIEEITDYCNKLAKEDKTESTVLNIPSNETTEGTIMSPLADKKKQETSEPPIRNDENTRLVHTEGDQHGKTKKYALISCIVACVILIGGYVIFRQMGTHDNVTTEIQTDSNEVAGNVSVAVVVLKSADKQDYYALADNGNGQYKVVKSELNYAPSDKQIDVAVSTNNSMNQLNKIDALLESIHSTYASAKVIFIAQKNLAADPSMQAIDKKLSGMGISISYYNPSKYSGNETSMVEEYVSQHGIN